MSDTNVLDDRSDITEPAAPASEPHTLPPGPCMIVISGHEMGMRFALDDAKQVIGRSSQCDLPIYDPSVSRRHAIISRHEGRFVVTDLDSSNGTFVNDRQVGSSPLADGDQVRVGSAILKFLDGTNVEGAYHAEVYKLTTTDTLTQTYNRRFLIDQLAREMARALRYRRDLSLIFFDIDHFKACNDRYGHVAGDKVLFDIAERVRRVIRRADTVARYGGEEFAIIAPEVSRLGARVLAEKVRRTVEQDPFVFEDQAIRCTISAGVADILEYLDLFNGSREEEMRRAQGDVMKFLVLADDKLLHAKETGRNRVVV